MVALLCVTGGLVWLICKSRDLGKLHFVFGDGLSSYREEYTGRLWDRRVFVMRQEIGNSGPVGLIRTGIVILDASNHGEGNPSPYLGAAIERLLFYLRRDDNDILGIRNGSPLRKNGIFPHYGVFPDAFKQASDFGAQLFRRVSWAVDDIPNGESEQSCSRINGACYRMSNIGCYKFYSPTCISILKAEIHPRLEINFYPRAVNHLQLARSSLSGFFGLEKDSIGESRIDDDRRQGSDIQMDFPKRRFMMAALTGFLCMFWGWLNLRRETRESVEVLVLIIGICLWAYAVFGFVHWRFQL